MTFCTSNLRSLLLAATLSAGLATVALAPVGIAQTSLGTLTGVVRDSSGAVVVGANITLTNLQTGDVRKITANSLGAYRVDALTPGTYTLHVQMTGFEQFAAKGVTITASTVQSYDPVLKPGHVDETVAVTADAVLLDKENASLSGTISSETMEKLPIFTLNPIEVLTTVPGVQIVSNSTMSNGQSIQVSGARPRSNNYMVDGEEINDATIAGQAVQPNIPDMYADTIIYTHNAPAEFGRASGGVVNLITKGGTNSFHGSAWELYSGSGLNAMDGQTRQITPNDRANKARFDQHQYGFTVGGPILKDKLFAFGGGQWSRYYGNETASQIALPTADGVALLKQLAGGSGTVATNATMLLGYLSNASYLNSFADLTNGQPVLADLGNACPDPNTGCSLALGVYQRPPTPEQNPDTQWTYRIDYTPRSKDTFTARYLHDRSSLTPDFFTNGSALPGFDTYQGGPSELGQGTWTHIFTPTLLNEFRAAETRLSFLFAPTAESIANPLYNAPNISTSGEIEALGFSHSSYPQGRGQDMYQFQDTVTWTRGRNTIRMGVDIGRRIETDLIGLNTNGSLNFTDGGNGGTAVGNFLLNELGPSGSATRTFGNTRVDPHSWRSGVFAQDDIKVSADLTVNVGVRYDYFTDPDNSLPYPAIDPTSTATLFGPIDTVVKVKEDKNNIAPRIGFAYTPHNGTWWGDGKTVIRGGFGIFFDSEFTNITLNTAENAPNVAAGEIQQLDETPITNATGLISQIQPVVDPYSTVEAPVKGLVTPYSPEWNIGFERELPGQIVLNATYVGSRGIKLYANQQYNYVDPSTGARVNGDRGVIIARGNFADSDYNGLEVGVRHNFAHGLAVNGSYTYSKTMDDGSEVFTTDSSPTSYSANLAPGGRSQDWGNSAYDHRHYLAFTYVWTPAGLHSSNRGWDTFLSGATRHWTISGTSRFQSGSYGTVNTYGKDINGDGSSSNDRPILVDKDAPFTSVGVDGYHYKKQGLTPGVYYDMAAYNQGQVVAVDPTKVHWLIPHGAQYLHQEIGRNSYLTPGLLYDDIALEKALPTSWLHMEHGQFVLRAEAQNFANHNNVNLTTTFGGSSSGYGVDRNLNLLNVGKASFLNTAEARETQPRALRFWAKFTF